MKVAIAAETNSMNSHLDRHFGRCRYFIIYEIETRSTEIIPNPYADAEENSGPSAVKLLISRNVNKVISAEFGIKIKSLLDSNRIQMIVIKTPGIKVQSIIDMLNKKQN